MLEGRRVRLVPMDVGDITDSHIDWLNDPETFRFLGTKFGQTCTTVRHYVESISAPNLLCKIVCTKGNRHVGNIALQGFDPIHRCIELGVIIGEPEARGKGFGKEACSLIIQHAFDHLNVHKIAAGTVDENVAMKKVFLDLGFSIEGTLVEHYYLEGNYRDVYRFGLLRGSFVRHHESAY